MTARIMTDEMYDSIPGLLAQGMNRRQIADRFGTTESSLQVLCSRRGISLRRVDRPLVRDPSIRLHPEIVAQLRGKAEQLGITYDHLAARLLRTIVNDNLYSAVLDENPLL